MLSTVLLIRLADVFVGVYSGPLCEHRNKGPIPRPAGHFGPDPFIEDTSKKEEEENGQEYVTRSFKNQ